MRKTSKLEPDNLAKSAIIWIHGLGADGYDLHPLANALKLGSTRHIFPSAPVIPVTMNNNTPMPAWFDITSLESPRLLDFDVIKPGVEQINKLINEQINSGIEAKNIFLIGFSQGGSVALATGLSLNRKIAGIAGLSTFFPKPDTNNMPLTEQNQTTPIFLAHGTADQVLQFALGEATKRGLEENNFNISWHSYDMGHEVIAQEVQDLQMWIDDALK